MDAVPFFAAVPVGVVTPGELVALDILFMGGETVGAPLGTGNDRGVVVGKWIGSSGYTTVAVGADAAVEVTDMPESQGRSY